MILVLVETKSFTVIKSCNNVHLQAAIGYKATTLMAPGRCSHVEQKVCGHACCDKYAKPADASPFNSALMVS